MTDSSFKTLYKIVNEALVGPTERLNNPNGFHPMLRQNWNMSDRLRAVLGRYQTVYKSSRGYTLWPYPNPGNATDHESPSLGRLEFQTENLVIQISNMEQIENSSRSAQINPTLQVVPKSSAWNYYNNMVPGAMNWIGSWEGNTLRPPLATLQSSRQNFYNYIANPDSFTVVTQDYKSLLNDDSLVSPHEDYACCVYSISGKKDKREAIGTSLGVLPKYNYYVGPYESAIAPSEVSETYLPNIYIMQSEMHNESATPLTMWHVDTLNVGGAAAYMLQDGTAVTEETTKTAYEVYAQTFTGISSIPAGQLATAAQNNSTFVVLSSDEKALLGEYISDTLVPFVNEIQIPQDPQARTGLNSGQSLFTWMADKPDAAAFIDILQVMCINTLEGYRAPGDSSGEYRVTTKNVLSATDASDIQYETAQNSYSYLVNMMLELNNYVNAIHPNLQAQTAIAKAQDIINEYVDPTVLPAGGPPYRFIRDYARCLDSAGNGFSSDPSARLEIPPGTAQAAYAQILNDYPAFMRTYIEILQGQWCHTETLMYVVSKHEVNENGSDGALVQKFYLTNRFRTDTLGRAITFYDSQVKYEKKYRYKIQKMVAIFGNAYSYDTSVVLDLSEPAAVPVEVQNMGNLKVILLPYTAGPDPEDQGLESLIVDSPPVPPEVSFYAHQGVANRVRLLLNSSTGDYHMPPIAIQDTDPAFFEMEYASQQGATLTYEQIREQKKTIHFRSDDPVDRYQVFRTSTPPTGYESFVDAERISPDLDPTYGTPADFMDTIEPNVTYYYCVRSVDVHDNISNPSPIIEVEMVDNAGQIYLRQKPYVFETVKQPLTISGRKYILIEPAARQVEYQSDAQPLPVTTNDTPTVHLGEANIADSIWNKDFKVRLVSKKTGRKIDLNLNFKNSGIVKGSE